MSVRLTQRRLEVIIDALAYWETIIEDRDCGLYETEAEWRVLEHDREQAFAWAWQQLNARRRQEAE